MARPRKEIERYTFEELCKIQCTQIEICDVLNVDHKTLNGWVRRTYGEDFSQVYKKFSSVGKNSVKRMLLKLAERNAAACIFLAKNWCGMQEAPRQEDEELSKEREVIQSISNIEVVDDEDKP